MSCILPCLQHDALPHALLVDQMDPRLQNQSVMHFLKLSTAATGPPLMAETCQSRFQTCQLVSVFSFPPEGGEQSISQLKCSARAGQILAVRLAPCQDGTLIGWITTTLGLRTAEPPLALAPAPAGV